MQSRNKREGYYFGKSYQYDYDEEKILGNGYHVEKRLGFGHKRVKGYWISLKGFFKGMNKK